LKKKNKTDFKSEKKPISPKGGGILEGQAGPGRPKGMKNKFTSLKDSFLKVFQGLGGTAELLRWAQLNRKNQALFYSWLVKMLPAGISEEKSPDAEALETQLKNIADAMQK
jgi:hypothetical protein